MSRYQPLQKPTISYDDFKKNGVSPFHLLYEGRYMMVPRGFGYGDRDTYYPNEHEVQAEKAYIENREQVEKNAKELNDLAFKQSGSKRIMRHPAIEPDSLIEDPKFKYVQFNSERDIPRSFESRMS